MSEDSKSDGLTVGILLAMGVVVLAALGVGSVALRRYQSAREQERRAQVASNLAQIRQAIEAMEDAIVITGQVESFEPASSEVPVHACPASVHGEFWVVKFEVLENPRGNYPFEECNVLIHSPSADLGIQQAGQKLRLRLRLAKQPPQLTAGSPDQMATVQFANPDGPFELVSHERIE